MVVKPGRELVKIQRLQISFEHVNFGHGCLCTRLMEQVLRDVHTQGAQCAAERWVDSLVVQSQCMHPARK